MSSGPHGLNGSVPADTVEDLEQPPQAHVMVPIQVTPRAQLPSVIDHIVQDMIPQIDRQIPGPNGRNNNTAGGLPSRSSNPFINQIQNMPGQGHSHSGNPRHGHVRSYSHGYGPHFHSHGNLPFHPAQQHGHIFQAQAAAQSSPQPSSPLNSSFVVDMGEAGENPNPLLQQDTNNNAGQQPGSQQRANTGATVSNDTYSGLRSLLKAFEGSLPFILLLLTKVLISHRLGILVMIGLFGTFYHADSSLKKQIAQRENHSLIDTLGNLCWIIIIMSANIFFIYYVFEDQVLYKSLYFQVPNVGPIDMWNMFWIVGVTDFIIKYATIIIKVTITLLPKHILHFKKKGKYYMLIEVLSQFYRSLIPIVPWFLYLQEDNSGIQWVASLLCLLYVLFKGNHVYNKVKEVKKAFSKFRADVSYGSVPSSEQLQACDNSCPICQDKFTDPVMLSCTHIFCENCVSMWFDRERTCPMCRAQIADNPIWRDGSTDGKIQLY